MKFSDGPPGKGKKRRGRSLGVFLVLLAFAPGAAATLGAGPNSVENDRIQLRGTLHLERAAAFEVHEIRAVTGVVVREYVAGGVVFGLAWEGPVTPDLTQLLGAYYEPFLQAAEEQRAQRRGRGPVLVHLPDLIVELGGHMRAFAGRAYLPARLPQGVPAEAVR